MDSPYEEFGGRDPIDYVREHGHPRLRMRHARVEVNLAMRDAWLRCMFRAMGESAFAPELDSFLRQRLVEVANAGFQADLSKPRPDSGAWTMNMSTCRRRPSLHALWNT